MAHPYVFTPKAPDVAAAGRRQDDLALGPILVLVAWRADAPAAVMLAAPAMGRLTLHWRVLGRPGRTVLERLFARPVIARHFVLCGGTALAVQAGHRRSKDLDLFSVRGHPSLDSPAALSDAIRASGEIRNWRAEEGRVDTLIDGVRLQIVPYPTGVLRRPLRAGRIRLAHPVDIGAMKLAAIMDRGKRRDFIDLACILDRWATLGGLIRHLRRMIPGSADPTMSVARALLDVRGAERETDPAGLGPGYRWSGVRDRLASEARNLMKAVRR